jgi:hypothetical protein
VTQPTNPPPPRCHPDWLHTNILDMKIASAEFYRMATAIGVHSFIEFAGLMNEYINLCADALKGGQDYTQANVHTGTALPMQAYHARYLAEKLGCIYGSALTTSPQLTRAFLERLYGNVGDGEDSRRMSVIASFVANVTP